MAYQSGARLLPDEASTNVKYLHSTLERVKLNDCMKTLCCLLAVGWICLCSASLAHAQTETPPGEPSSTPTRFIGTQSVTPIPELSIQSPLSGEVLQGNVTLAGFSALPGFVSAEVSFAYEENPTGVWFLISELTQPVSGGTLAQWDTSVITDGEYTLRLTVMTEDGSIHEALVSGLRVRNYSQIETETPTPITPTNTPAPGSTPATAIILPTTRPTPTALPTNPAVITSQNLATSLGKGALAVVGFFAFLGIYHLVRKVRESD
jgi:hypothetical protein